MTTWREKRDNERNYLKEIRVKEIVKKEKEKKWTKWIEITMNYLTRIMAERDRAQKSKAYKRLKNFQIYYG